jgi:hypothetical protein
VHSIGPEIFLTSSSVHLTYVMPIAASPAPPSLSPLHPIQPSMAAPHLDVPPSAQVVPPLDLPTAIPDPPPQPSLPPR